MTREHSSGRPGDAAADFEPSFTTKPPGEGTSLGLAVVHGIMDNHDGSVTVCSQPGAGTVFHLYFPAHASEATGAAACFSRVGACRSGPGCQLS